MAQQVVHCDFCPANFAYSLSILKFLFDFRLPPSNLSFHVMKKRGFELKVELFWLFLMEQSCDKLSSQTHQEIRCVFMTLH